MATPTEKPLRTAKPRQLINKIPENASERVWPLVLHCLPKSFVQGGDPQPEVCPAGRREDDLELTRRAAE